MGKAKNIALLVGALLIATPALSQDVARLDMQRLANTKWVFQGTEEVSGRHFYERVSAPVRVNGIVIDRGLRVSGYCDYTQSINMVIELGGVSESVAGPYVEGILEDRRQTRYNWRDADSCENSDYECAPADDCLGSESTSRTQTVTMYVNVGRSVPGSTAYNVKRVVVSGNNQGKIYEDVFTLNNNQTLTYTPERNLSRAFVLQR